jgi:hypothetical protein
MDRFGLANIKGRELIMKKYFNSLDEAYIYWANLKKIPIKEFKKIFIVVKL